MQASDIPGLGLWTTAPCSLVTGFFLFFGVFFWSVLVPDPATLLLSFPHQEEFCKLVAALCDHLHQSLSLSLVILTLVSARTFMTGCPLVQSPEKMT